MRHRPLLSASLSLLFAGQALAQAPVVPVEHFELDRYAGQWHEIAHLPVSFQKRCVAEITASYRLRSDGRISVLNRCRVRDGSLLEAEGVARQVAGHPGRLQVRFAPDWLSWLPWVWADYWVIALDPDYQWAMIGEPGRDYLWILSRTPSMDSALFERLKRQATDMGYDLAPLRVVVTME
ncbi:lipocalin family protein [Stenotrophomonas mori]|uniref:Outer membrane lipoprotein Blc n=1 Tax=Stenotrophomonas mori TaxID=2871096 RepID=A0ABT0SGF1_9GAMM|nr:lipocalin family protein [Stenotrophomonas mori]MCL7714079.1 lipocalin family protein [Stenotrophomonas mori]